MKKLLLIAFLLIAPLGAHASTQVLSGTGFVSNNAAPRFYAATYGGSVNNGTENLTALAMPFAGTLSNLRVSASTTPSIGYYVVKFRKNLTDTSVGCIIDTTHTQCTDAFHSLALSTGDTFDIAVTPVGAPDLLTLSWSYVLTPTNPNDTLALVNKSTSSISAVAYTYPIADSSSQPSASTIVPTLLPEGGVLDDLYVALSAAPGTTATRDFFASKNSATTTTTCTIGSASTNCQDTTHPLTITAGDLMNYASVPNTAPATAIASIAMRFRPTTSGDFDFFSGTQANSATQGFLYLNGRSIVNPVESTAQQVAPIAMTINTISAAVSNPPGGTTNSRTFTLNVNGVGTALTCTMTGSGQSTCSISTPISVNAGDLLDIHQVQSSAQSATEYVSLVATASAPSTPATKTIYLTSGSSWTVPGDFTSTNMIECIGNGGSGGPATANTNAAGGGGGGAYGRLYNLAVAPGSAISYVIGASGSGNDTYFNGVASTSASLSCAPGNTSVGATGGNGGSIMNEANGFASGGNGGIGRTGTGSTGGGGGGGSAGTNGGGFVGGAGIGSAAGGGGGSDGGLASAGAAASVTGGAGGNGTNGTGSGAGGVSATTPGISGTSGGGGGGGVGSSVLSAYNGGAGGCDSSNACGGGGGAGGASASVGIAGNGGTYGGGGGGAGANASVIGTAGTGGQGIIMITYVPFVAKHYCLGGSCIFRGGSVSLR